MFSRFSLSPSGILNWDSTQRKEDCFPSLPFSIRPWVGYPLYSSYEGKEGSKHSCGFSLFSQKEHLNRTESGLISYVFGVIMLESKKQVWGQITDKNTLNIKGRIFFSLQVFSLSLSSHQRDLRGSAFQIVTWEWTNTSFLRQPDMFMWSYIKIHERKKK